MYPSLIDEPAREYHANAMYYMSSHKLSSIRKEEEYDSSDKPAYRIGRWSHVHILEGAQRFFEECVVGGPCRRDGKSYAVTSKRQQVAAAECKDKYGMELVPPDTWEMLCDMRRAVRRNHEAAELLQAGAPEKVGRGTYLGVNCQIRCDWLTPNRQLVDLKTCRELGRFKFDALNYDYVHQLAFYREMLRIVTGEVFDVFIIAVQKTNPASFVYHLSDRILSAAQVENEDTLRKIAQEEGNRYVAH